MEVYDSEYLNVAELHQIITKAVGDSKTWKILNVEEKKASDGITGFLGDHHRMTINVEVDGKTKNINLFLKVMPNNDNKAAFIKESKLFAREATTLTLIDKITTPDPYPWCTTAYLKNDSIVVMPDLAIEGYTSRTTKNLDDLPHALLTAVALARFHAAFANYETGRKEKISFLEEYGDQLMETVFMDTPPIRAGTLLHKNFLKAFSNKYANIDVKLLPLYLEACESVKNYDNTLNTLIHRDLWANNIMFKYENEVPVNALLVDFQLVRYAPPAFDPMLFLYMTTSKTFRVQHGETFLKKYFETFIEKTNEDTKKRLNDLKYDWFSFREWCEKARKFALMCAIHIMPITLFDPINAEKIFNNDNGYKELLLKDRSKPIIAYAKHYPDYKQRLLDMFEEFIDISVQNNKVQ